MAWAGLGFTVFYASGTPSHISCLRLIPPSQVALWGRRGITWLQHLGYRWFTVQSPSFLRPRASSLVL